MRYCDVFQHAYEMPREAVEPYRLSRRGMQSLLRRGGVSPEELSCILPKAAQGAKSRVIILSDGDDYFAVPAEILEKYPPSPNPRFDLVEEIPPLVFEVLPDIVAPDGEWPPQEPCPTIEELLELDDEPFDYEAHYKAELALPGVRRIHDYYRGVNTYEVFFDSHDPRAQKSRSFTYGDTAVPAIRRTLAKIGAGPDDVFVDLGCGCGAAVLTAAGMVKRARGIDLVPGVVDFCRSAADRLDIRNAEFEVGDIRHADLSEATIVYCAATTFPARLVRAINRRLQQARPGTRVVSITQPMGARGLRLTGQEYLMFSWSGDRYAINHTVYHQVRV